MNLLVESHTNTEILGIESIVNWLRTQVYRLSELMNQIINWQIRTRQKRCLRRGINNK